MTGVHGAYQDAADRVEEAIADAGEAGITYRELARAMNRSVSRMQTVVVPLVRAGRVRSELMQVRPSCNRECVLRIMPHAREEARARQAAAAERRARAELQARLDRVGSEARSAFKVLERLSARSPHALAAAAGYSYRRGLQLWRELERAGVA